jgi:hypothetical protein
MIGHLRSDCALSKADGIFGRHNAGLLGLCEDAASVSTGRAERCRLKWPTWLRYPRLVVATGCGEIMSERYSFRAQSALNRALELAQNAGQAEIGSDHLLLALTEMPDALAGQALARVNVDPVEVLHFVGDTTRHGADRGSPAHVSFSREAERAMIRALLQCRVEAADWIGTEHLLLGLLDDEDSTAAAVFRRLGVTQERVEAAVRDVKAGGGIDPDGAPGPEVFQSLRMFMNAVAGRGSGQEQEAVARAVPAPYATREELDALRAQVAALEDRFRACW